MIIILIVSHLLAIGIGYFAAYFIAYPYRKEEKQKAEYYRQRYEELTKDDPITLHANFIPGKRIF